MKKIVYKLVLLPVVLSMLLAGIAEAKLSKEAEDEDITYKISTESEEYMAQWMGGSEVGASTVYMFGYDPEIIFEEALERYMIYKGYKSAEIKFE